MNKDDAGSEAVLEYAVKSSAAGEKEILGVGDSDSDVLGVKGSKITIAEAYSEKSDSSHYTIKVAGFVTGVDYEDIDKGTVSIYLNDESKGTCTAYSGIFNGDVVDVGPGKYYVRVSYHDDSGDYGDSQNEYYDNPIIIEPPEPTTWYVNGSKSYGGGGKSAEDAFSTLNEALVAASNNDTVKIAAGTYVGDSNIGGYIQKILTFEKYGDGEAIFDGKGQRIWYVSANSINISGLTFINGGGTYGGALYFLSDASDSVINATFIDNTVTSYGGAIYVENSVSNLTLRSTFINNTAKYGAAVYINSTASNLILNSTADPSELDVGNSSQITFKLSSFGGSEIIDYDASKMNIVLNLSQTLGELDKTSALIGEKITYTAKDSGNATVTGKFETASYTVSLTNVDSKTPTSINITNSTLDLKVNDEVPSGATLTPADAGNVTYTPGNSSVAIVKNGKIKALAVGSTNITVSFAGDDTYAAAENKTIEVTVSLNEANWTYIDRSGSESALDGDIILLPWNYPSPVCFVKDADGVGLPVGTKVTILCEGDKNYVINTTTAKNGQFSVDLSNVELGRYEVTFSTEGYTTATVTVYLIQAPTEIIVANSTLDLKVNEEVPSGATLTPADAGNLTYTPGNSSVAIVKNGKIIAVGVGSTNITVSFAGDYKYFAAENKTIEVTVTLNDASVSVNNATLDLLVGDEFVVVATTVPEGLDVTFTPDNSGVVSFDENGVVTALKEGETSVKVSVGGDGVYALNTTTVTVTVTKIPTSISAKVDSELTVGDNSKVNYTLTPSNATGKVSFKSSDSKVLTVDSKGNVKAVGEGSATITVTYAGDDKYAPSNATVSVKVSKSEIEPEIKQNGTNLTVTVPSDATGDVTVTIGNKTIKAPIKDGKAVIDLSDLPGGDYNATVSYPGDSKYSGFDVVAPVSIGSEFQLIAENLTKYYHGSERFVVMLVDGKGNPISDAEVKIFINGVTYTRITDKNGSASIGINLESGEYIATVSYNDAEVNATVTVLTTVNGTDLVKVFRNATQYYATFRDSEGNYLKDGTTVRFNIHGVIYDRTVSGGKGLAKLNINLEQGNYIITAINLETGESRANNITVLPRIVENYDLTKYYRNASQYTVKLIGDDGKAVGAGENVTFNINGVFYTRTTNASGIAKLNINLQPGDYIITAGYKNCMVSNNIKVLSVLTAKDLTKKYGTKDQFTATLVDGQGKAYAGQSVQFNINGVFYYRTTDSNGQAKLNINLQPGEYIITSSYNGANIGNKVTVTA